MQFQGIIIDWNDERGFGYIESTQGGAPIFVHISAWPRGTMRPQLNQRVSFEIEVGPKGKRACNVRPMQLKQAAPHRANGDAAQWRGATTHFAIPAFLLFYAIIAALWQPPFWVAGIYLIASIVTFLVYAIDKSSAVRGTWRTSEHTLHCLALAGGWPGALLAQQFLRHKSTKQVFLQVFWVTVALNIAALVFLVSPLRSVLFGAV